MTNYKKVLKSMKELVLTYMGNKEILKKLHIKIKAS
jgi:hypothetical protein